MPSISMRAELSRLISQVERERERDGRADRPADRQADRQSAALREIDLVRDTLD